MTKLSPASLGGWLLGSRRWRAVAAAAVTLVAVLLVSVIGAGLNSFREYLDVAATTAPSTSSLSGLSGISWLSPVAFVVNLLEPGTLAAGERFIVTVISVSRSSGTPSLYLSGLVVLLATLAPFTDRPPTGQEERDPAAGFMAVAA